MSDNANTQNQTNNDAPMFDVLRVYAKDCSLETPNVPQIFTKEWKPEIKVDFDAKTQAVNQDSYEVDLRVTVTCNIEKETAFICEVHQAGIFLVHNIDAETTEYLLNGVAPNMLFPYAREHIASLVNRASFPQLNLRPINFEAMFRAHKAEQAAKSDVANGEAKDSAPQA
ncbi:MAG: protein-export chaperone SecB [Succinivibrio sp.]